MLCIDGESEALFAPPTTFLSGDGLAAACGTGGGESSPFDSLARQESPEPTPYLYLELSFVLVGGIGDFLSD